MTANEIASALESLFSGARKIILDRDPHRAFMYSVSQWYHCWDDRPDKVSEEDFAIACERDTVWAAEWELSPGNWRWIVASSLGVLINHIKETP